MPPQHNIITLHPFMNLNSAHIPTLVLVNTALCKIKDFLHVVFTVGYGCI